MIVTLKFNGVKKALGIWVINPLFYCKVNKKIELCNYYLKIIVIFKVLLISNDTTCVKINFRTFFNIFLIQNEVKYSKTHLIHHILQ